MTNNISKNVLQSKLGQWRDRKHPKTNMCLCTECIHNSRCRHKQTKTKCKKSIANENNKQITSGNSFWPLPQSFITHKYRTDTSVYSYAQAHTHRMYIYMDTWLSETLLPEPKTMAQSQHSQQLSATLYHRKKHLISSIPLIQSLRSHSHLLLFLAFSAIMT